MARPTKNDIAQARQRLIAMNKFKLSTIKRKSYAEILETLDLEDKRTKLLNYFDENNIKHKLSEKSRKTTIMKQWDKYEEEINRPPAPIIPTIDDDRYPPELNMIAQDSFRHSREIRYETEYVYDMNDFVYLMREEYKRLNVPTVSFVIYLESGKNLIHRTFQVMDLDDITVNGFEDFMNKLYSGTFTGSDQLAVDYVIDYERLSVRYITIFTDGKTDFVYADDTYDDKKEVIGCIFRAIKDQIDEEHHEIFKNMRDIGEMIYELKQLGYKYNLYTDEPDLKNIVIKGANYDKITTKKGRFYILPECTDLYAFESNMNGWKNCVNVVWNNFHCIRYNGIKGDRKFYMDNKFNVLSIMKDKELFEKDSKMKKIVRDGVARLCHLKTDTYTIEIVSFDFETIYDDKGKLKSYSITWTLDGEAIFILSDMPEECENQFIKYLLDVSQTRMFVLVGFNNGNFDNRFIIKPLMKADKLDDIFFNNNCMHNVKFSGRHCTFDLAKYCPMSLAKACKEYKIEFAKKGDFDHNVIQKHYNNYGNVRSYFHRAGCNAGDKTLAKYKLYKGSENKNTYEIFYTCDCPNYKKLVEYNLFDCLACVELYDKIEDIMADSPLSKADGKNSKEFHLFDNRTIGGAIYKMFSASCKKQKIVHPALNFEQYTRIRSGMVAGRTQCYDGAQSDMTGKNEYDMIDVVSLYPYVMLNRDYPAGKIIENDVYTPDKIGFYNCIVNQKALKNKIIPYRGKTLNWNYDGDIECYISNIDIECLLKHGASVQIFSEGSISFTDKISGKTMFECLNYFKDIKENEDNKKEAGEEYNSALRTTAKAMLNSLSGKMNESLHFEQYKFVNSAKSEDDAYMLSGCDSSRIFVEDVEDANYSIVKVKLTDEKAFKNAKPVYIGVLIYAYARLHMYDTVISKYNPIYQDTDSALLLRSDRIKLFEDRPELIAKDVADLEEGESNFGRYSYEFDTANKFITIAPKNYFIFKDDKLLKKGFKGVKLDRDKLFTDMDLLKKYELKNGKHKIDIKEAFNLYNGNVLPTVADSSTQFIEQIKNNGCAYVLCSSLQKSMRNNKTSQAGAIKQVFVIKRINS